VGDRVCITELDLKIDLNLSLIMDAIWFVIFHGLMWLIDCWGGELLEAINSRVCKFNEL